MKNFPEPYMLGPIEVRFEQNTPGYAYSYVLYKEGKPIGEVFSGQDSPKNVATIAASFTLLEAVKDMRHDLEIFYGKYRDPDNKYINKIREILAFVKKESHDHT